VLPVRNFEIFLIDVHIIFFHMDHFLSSVASASALERDWDTLLGHMLGPFKIKEPPTSHIAKHHRWSMILT